MSRFSSRTAGRAGAAIDRRRLIRALIGAGAAGALPARLLAQDESDAPTEPTAPDGPDANQTSWAVDGLPEIGAMAGWIADTLAGTAHTFQLNGRQVSGTAAGRLYPPIFARDTGTVQSSLPFFLAPDFTRTSVEAFLASQEHFGANPATAGAVSAVVDATGRYDKATVVSDEETSVVLAARAHYDAFGGVDWLLSEVDGQSVLDRLGASLDYLHRARRWGDTELLVRGHTTDWGDVKREPGPEPTDLADGDDLTISPFDQAWYYRALEDLAEMLASADRPDDADARRALAAKVREQTVQELWQADRGHFLVHRHITDWVDPFDEPSIVPVSSALAIHAGMVTPDQVEPIFAALQGAADQAGTDRAGLTLYPAYPSEFFESRSMAAGEYQNGAVWDWWGGLQTVSEFEHGRAETAIGHLIATARAWQEADGVYEWAQVPTHAAHGSPDFTGAAGTYAQAVIRGLFGVRLNTDGFALAPRLGDRSGWLRATRPGGGSIWVEQETHPAVLYLEYSADAAGSGVASVRLPAGWQEVIGFFDGRLIETVTWNAGADRYAGGWTVPAGSHSIIVARIT